MKIRVGLGSCGTAAGGRKVMNRLVELISQDKILVEVEPTGCIGMCFYEPIVDIICDDGVYSYGNVTPSMVQEIVEQHVKNGRPIEGYLVSSPKKPYKELSKQVRIVLRNCGRINPERIDDYIKENGYRALEKVLKKMTPEEVIEIIKLSGLRGRGGAGFPTWFKWNAARGYKSKDKYIICNADEGDPGAFMDRSVLEGDPHSLIEGMVIGGYATGATKGYIYVRAEYPLAVERITKAISQARESNFLGKDVMKTGFDFDIDIKMGAGAFVCGEETALIASIEGERGMPRLKPPFPAEAGLWQKPTNINNVETYANVAWIINNGADKFTGYGTEKSKGTKVFALAGKVKKGGLVEVPMGMALREVIFDIGGGIKGDHEFKAVQMGGPSGGCIPKELLDTPVDYESIIKTGAIMGSGGMIVMDEETCMVDMARYFLDFICRESCGKCIHCRIGTKRMLETMERIVRGEGEERDIDELYSMALSIKDGSLCGLGQSAPNPVLTTLKHFRDEYTVHIKEKNCPAKSCKALIKYKILESKCIGCGACSRKCPVGAIKGENKKVYVIDSSKCIKCGACFNICRFNAVHVE